jgi:hypothetical protein
MSSQVINPTIFGRKAANAKIIAQMGTEINEN